MWSNDVVRDVVKKALDEKTEEAWAKYRKANKEAKRVVREAKGRDCVKFGEQLQKNFLENR